MLMATNSMVEVDDLSKLYARSPAAARRRAAGVFGGVLSGRVRTAIGQLCPSEFWALRNIAFRLERGESLGIIGLNGSGKTTLLRLLAGQLLPDEGEIRLGGSTTALIDLTAGFRMSATGRENVFLRGAMLGRSRAEMLDAFNEIVAFTELDDAIDAPVSTYSSGMLMRLAFAINLASEPDILLVDETLAVGDFRFRQKCLARLREIRERSCFILVSHSMVDIKRFCSRVVVLHHGQMVFQGEPTTAIEFYLNLEQSKDVPTIGSKPLIPATVYREDLIVCLTTAWVDESGKPSDSFLEGQAISFRCSFRLLYRPTNLVVGIPIYDSNDNLITGFSTDDCVVARQLEVGDQCQFILRIPNAVLNPGRYRAAIGIVDGVEHIFMDYLPDLRIGSRGKLSWGLVSVPHEWTIDSISPASTAVNGEINEQ